MTTRDRAIIEAIYDLNQKHARAPRMKEIGSAINMHRETIRYHIRRLTLSGYVDYFGGANLTPKAFRVLDEVGE